LKEEPALATPPWPARISTGWSARRTRRAAVGPINFRLARRLERAVDGVASVCAAVRWRLQRCRDEVFFESQ